MISKTKVVSFYYDYSDKNTHLVITDKYLQNIEQDIIINGFKYDEASRIPNIKFDYENNKLYIIENIYNGKIYRFNLTETNGQISNIQLEATASIPSIYGGKNVGHTFDLGKDYLYYGYILKPNKYEYYICKLDKNFPDNYAVNDTLKIDSTNKNLKYFLSYIKEEDYILFTTFSNSTDIFEKYKINSDLSSYYNTGPSCKLQIMQSNMLNFNNTLLKNPINNIYYSNYTIYNAYFYNNFLNFDMNKKYGNLFLIDEKISKKIKEFNYTIFNNISQNLNIMIGKNTGNVYYIGEKTCIVFDYDSNFLYKFDFTEFTNNSNSNPSTIAINQNTEEFYRNVNNIIILYDRYGEKIANSLNLNKKFQNLYCIVGSSEETPYAISPNKVVYPGSPNLVDNETPTIIFKVGINPDGWTQQFRIAFDTNIEKISNGDENTTYELVVDTWANGANYDANFNFQYSTDFDPSQNDPNNGTWNNLGTNDGLQSGGIVPDNGVSSLPNQPVYVKFTVPSNKGLTGIENGTNWYIKIFSYSKPQ